MFRSEPPVDASTSVRPSLARWARSAGGDGPGDRGQDGFEQALLCVCRLAMASHDPLQTRHALRGTVHDRLIPSGVSRLAGCRMNASPSHGEPATPIKASSIAECGS